MSKSKPPTPPTTPPTIAPVLVEEPEFDAEAVGPTEVEVNLTVTVPVAFVTKEVMIRVVPPAAFVLLAVDCVEISEIVDVDDWDATALD